MGANLNSNTVHVYVDEEAGVGFCLDRLLRKHGSTPLLESNFRREKSTDCVGSLLLKSEPYKALHLLASWTLSCNWL